MRCLRNVSFLDRAAPGKGEVPHSDAKTFLIAGRGLAAGPAVEGLRGLPPTQVMQADRCAEHPSLSAARSREAEAGSTRLRWMNRKRATPPRRIEGQGRGRILQVVAFSR